MKANPTPLMRTACDHAEDVVILAIDFADRLIQNGCELDSSEIVTAYCTAAAGAYQGLSLRHAVENAVERFLEGMEELRRRDNRDPCRQ
jgi:hypothetical protein